MEDDGSHSPCQSTAVQEIVENQTNSTTSSLPISNPEEPTFSISQEQLANLVYHNNTKYLHILGGVRGIADALQTNLDTGICGDCKDLHRRREVFGLNLNSEANTPLTKRSYLHQLTMDAFKDTTVILLLCCATLSLVLGIKRNGMEQGILDGEIIFFAIIIVVYISVLSKFWKNRRLKKLSRKKNVVTVLRGGRMQQIANSEVLVGHIVCLTNGDRVPADGLLVHRNALFKLDDDPNCEEEDFKHDEFPFMFTGAKVIGGECHMLVTSVGENTEMRKMMKSISSDQNKESELQIAVDKMNFRLEKVWLGLSLLVLLLQLIRCFTWEKGCDENHNPNPKGVKNTMEEIMNETTKIIKKQRGRVNGLVAILCILVFSVRDGLPLGIFLSFVFASRKMMPYPAIIRKLPACATIGSITTICTGRMADLALQHTKVVDLWIGLDNIKELSGGVVAIDVLNALREGIVMNTSGPEEHALVFWAQQVLNIDTKELEQWSSTPDHAKTVNINKSPSGLMLKRKAEGDNILVQMYWNGAPETVLPMCSHYYHREGAMETLDEHKRVVFKNMIERVATESLECIAFAFKQVVVQKEEEEALKLMENGLTLLGIVGFKNPLTSEVKEAVEACKEFGVKIKLVVGDNMSTARLMAINSGILNPEEDINGAVVEASEFRNSSAVTRAVMIDKICVMANASPSDKLLMVQCLKQKGEVVAVTGTCSRDSPSLKEADVGLLLGERSAEAAKEDSDIVILDTNFTTFTAILKWGRCVRSNIQKIIQVQLTLNIAAFSINYLIAALSLTEAPLAPFQVLWVDLLMKVLGALVLMVEMPLEPPFNSPPAEAGESIRLTSKATWRNIIVQVVYQVTIFLTMHFKGEEYFHADEKTINAMIFNTYVLCQVFVLLNARKIDRANVFEGMKMHCSPLFFMILVAILILHVAVIEIVTVVNNIERLLDLKKWCICVGVAAMSLPIGCAAKWISLP